MYKTIPDVLLFHQKHTASLRVVERVGLEIFL